MNDPTVKSKVALRVNKAVLRFRKDKLPPARTFYEAELGELRRPSRGWAQPKAGCPFHESASKTSFAVHLETGAFHCFGCSASGGDIIAFIMLRYGLSFKEACVQLGCWDEDARPIKVRRGPPVRYLVCDFIIDGVEHHEGVNDEPESELQLERRFYAEAKDRLTELRDGDTERFEGEEQVQWGIMATAWELIQMELGHGR